jgi:hypothetical protein
MPRLTQPQRIVIVIGLGAALYVFGLWAMTWGSHPFTGWTGYAPIPPTVNELHLWVRLLIWLVLIAIWSGSSALVLRSPKQGDDS